MIMQFQQWVSVSQPYPVVSEEVSFDELAYERKNLEVVEDVDALNVTETVVQNPSQLQTTATKKNLN